MPQHVGDALAQHGGEYGLHSRRQVPALDLGGDGDICGQEQRTGRFRLVFQRELAVAAGHRANVGECLTGDVEDLHKLALGLVRILGHQPVGQLALERDRREAVAKQIVQVPGEPQPLLGHGHLGKFGPCLVQFDNQVGHRVRPYTTRPVTTVVRAA